MNKTDDWGTGVGSRRHQLIEEAKAELDVAYEEVKRAELKVPRFEQPSNGRANPRDGAEQSPSRDEPRRPMPEKAALQTGDNMKTLYGLQNQAIERFSIVSSAFSIVGSTDDISVSVEMLRDVLFQANEVRNDEIEIHAALSGFVSGLHAFNLGDRSPESDRKVRQSWMETEQILRRLGRDI